VLDVKPGELTVNVGTLESVEDIFDPIPDVKPEVIVVSGICPDVDTLWDVTTEVGIVESCRVNVDRISEVMSVVVTIGTCWVVVMSCEDTTEVTAIVVDRVVDGSAVVLSPKRFAKSPNQGPERWSSTIQTSRTHFAMCPQRSDPLLNLVKWSSKLA